MWKTSAGTADRPALAQSASGTSRDERGLGDWRPRERRHTRLRPAERHGVHRGDAERGEGVISAAIAVLVMAGLGALMWVGFRTLWEDTEANTRDRVAEIGQ